MENTVYAPVAHLGGTAKVTLQEETAVAANALYDALQALKTVNRRDFQHEADFQAVVKQHEARIAAAQDLYSQVFTQCQYRPS